MGALQIRRPEMAVQPVLINGQWRAAKSSKQFHGENPATGEAIPFEFPISDWADIDAALTAAAGAAEELRAMPAGPIAAFLTRFAERIEARAAELAGIAHQESGLAVTPRLQ